MKKNNEDPHDAVTKAINNVFKEDYCTDLSMIISKVQDQDGKLPKKVVQIWNELHNGKATIFGDRELDVSISQLSYQIAGQYRHNVGLDVEREFLFVSWCRYAATFAHYKATFDLFLYAIDHEMDEDIIAFWSRKTIDLIAEELSYCFDKIKQNNLVQQAHLVIRRVSYMNPKLGLSHVFTLMQSRAQTDNPDSKHVLSSITDDLIEKIGGIRVLESIEPSGDRNVRAVCEKYEELVKIPVTLVRIGDLNSVKKTLDKEFPWFHKLTQKLISSLQLRLLGNGDFFIPPLLILGDAGIGKTSFSLRFSQLIKVPFRAISLAGKSDNRDLVGTSRGWGTGQPSMIISLINQHKVGNPIVLADEVDKCGGSDHNGRALDTLLTLFEPTSARHFFDEYLCGRCDFSRVSWICTANSVKQIPTTLLSRLDVVTVDKPEFEHYPAIVNRSITSFFAENGIHSAHKPVLEEADWGSGDIPS